MVGIYSKFFYAAKADLLLKLPSLVIRRENWRVCQKIPVTVIKYTLPRYCEISDEILLKSS